MIDYNICDGRTDVINMQNRVMLLAEHTFVCTFYEWKWNWKCCVSNDIQCSSTSNQLFRLSVWAVTFHYQRFIGDEADIIVYRLERVNVSDMWWTCTENRTYIVHTYIYIIYDCYGGCIIYTLHTYMVGMVIKQQLHRIISAPSTLYTVNAYPPQQHLCQINSYI